jgi:hypothetical protein
MAEITCPSCQRRLFAPSGCAGLLVQCAECQHIFAAPPDANASATSWPALDADAEKEAPERFRRPLLPHRGALIFVGGLFSVIGLTGAPFHMLFVLLALASGVASWIAGSTDLRELRAGALDPRGAWLVRGGRLLAIVGTLAALAYLVVRATSVS